MTEKPNFFYLFFLFVAMCIQCGAQPASGPWSLKDCLNYGLKNHPVLSQVEGTVDSARAQIGEIKSNFGFQVNGNANFLRQKDDFVKTTGSSGISPDLSMNDSTAESLSAKKLFSDWGRTRERQKSGVSVYKATKEDLKWQRTQVGGTIKTAFFQALQAKALIRVQKESLDGFKEHEDKVRGFVEVGSKTPYDLTKAQVDVANAQVALIKAENDSQNAMARLIQAIGLDGPIEISEGPESFGLASAPEIKKEDLSEKLYKRPDLSAAEFRYDSTSFQLNAAKKSLKPAFSGSANYGWNGTATPLNRSWNVGMALSFPFLDGKLTHYQVKDAEGSLKSAKGRLQNLKIQASTDLEIAIHTLREAFKRFETSQILLKSASETLHLAEGRYEAGLGSPIEITDARTGYYNAEGENITAYYDTLVALTQLDIVTGVLPPEYQNDLTENQAETAKSISDMTQTNASLSKEISLADQTIASDSHKTGSKSQAIPASNLPPKGLELVSGTDNVASETTPTILKEIDMTTEAVPPENAKKAK
ncbi:MAG: TolC family protein [Candidatus Riflebacteria bacterium]|nr:TolC family protein [Candidatus Riflebacteria bacterium]